VRAAAVALAGCLALLAAPGAHAATRTPEPPSNPFPLAVPSQPLRDVVVRQPNRTAARISASGRAQRYDVHDGKGRSVSINVSTTCSVLCSAADPQQIADFLGTLVHGDEMNLLAVDLETPAEIEASCPGASACYFPGLNRMLISGDDSTGGDGATREFVIAHEYGHHVADHRTNPPFNPAISWGPKHWSSYEHICQGVRQGRYFPGDEGGHYYENPGEAYAESSAFLRFPGAPVPWEWIPSLKPDAGAFAAIRSDVLNPWQHDVARTFRGRLHAGHKQVTKRIRTPLDGNLSLYLQGARGSHLALAVRNPSGRVVRRSHSRAQVGISYTVCGSRSLDVMIKREGRGPGRYRLVVHRP
jgi:hypothetical protein